MFILPLLLTGFFLSLVIAILGRNRKMGFWGYFFASLLLTPLFGLLLLLISGEKTPR